MNRELLMQKNIKELREIGKEYNVNDKSKEGLVNKILDCYEGVTDKEIEDSVEDFKVHEEEELNTQLGDEEFDEFERNQDGKILMMEDIEEEVYIETVTDITEHIKTIELYQNEHKWIKLKYNMIKKRSGKLYIDDVIALSDKILSFVDQGIIEKVVV